MRVARDEINFSSYLLKICDGTAQIHPQMGQDMIQIPSDYLVNKVFPNIEDGYLDKYWAAR